MGWASGSELAEDVWDTVRKYIPVKNRRRVARKIVDLFEQQDCDTIHECEKLMNDAEIPTFEDD